MTPIVLPVPAGVLNAETAAAFASMALANIAREYPTKLDHFINGAEDVKTPAALHPVFWGSFDWHSCVHSHWMLARLLRMFPDATFVQPIRALFDGRFTAANVAGEVAYLRQDNRGSFVRTYGWAWLLKLAEELELGSRSGPFAEAFEGWKQALHPLTLAFVSLYLSYLPRARVPLRYGLHPNSAFGLAFAIDCARTLLHEPLAALCATKAIEWFGADADYPAQFEPSGNEFLSPALVEADLMRRVLDRPAFTAWLGRFLPGLAAEAPAALFMPAEAIEHSDPQMVHLDGLNLSRAWCLGAIADALDGEDERRPALLAAAARHLAAGLPHVQSGDYMGEHWLATFAVYALTSAPLKSVPEPHDQMGARAALNSNP